MGLLRQISDYGSESSTSSSNPWLNLDPAKYQLGTGMDALEREPASLRDLSPPTGRSKVEDVMREFRMNGYDRPYEPEDDSVWARLPGEETGPVYCRQRSWPAAERPAGRARPRSLHDWASAPADSAAAPHFDFEYSTPIHESPSMPFLSPAPNTGDYVTQEQFLALSSMPDSALYTLLRGLHAHRRINRLQGCRFCRNNGDRESFYRSHLLKDAAGRVTCPVLRAFVCKRCGASGDHAHTIKYCPFSTTEERARSAAMMRSVRAASAAGRRRVPADAAPAPRPAAALDPLWAALEKKLML